MIECIFTIDYEIYGNGEGSLKDLIYGPAEQLGAAFEECGARFVAFVETAELEVIRAAKTDPGIHLVEEQIRDLYSRGFEIALHVHPQWYNGRHQNGAWLLDYEEYNLCVLSRDRICEILDRSLAYLREVVGSVDFTPLSFRAGNWLFQPSAVLAEALAEREVKIDSSVFKGGVQQCHRLDYRRALRNGSYWRFGADINVPDPHGPLLELPIYTQMVPPWEMVTGKRMAMRRKGPSAGGNGTNKFRSFLDLVRFRYPLKLDFCRMTLDELTRVMDSVITLDGQDLATFRPIVAIGHTKDLVDLEAIKRFLSYLEKKKIAVSTFHEVFPRCTL